MYTVHVSIPTTEALPYIHFIFTVLLHHCVPLRLSLGLERKEKDEQDHGGKIDMIQSASWLVLPWENVPVSPVFSHLDKGTLERGTLLSSTKEKKRQLSQNRHQVNALSHTIYVCYLMKLMTLWIPVGKFCIYMPRSHWDQSEKRAVDMWWTHRAFHQCHQWRLLRGHHLCHRQGLHPEGPSPGGSRRGHPQELCSKVTHLQVCCPLVHHRDHRILPRRRQTSAHTFMSEYVWTSSSSCSNLFQPEQLSNLLKCCQKKR